MMSFVIVFCDCFVCHRDEVYTRRKLALGYMDLTDLEGLAQANFILIESFYSP